MIRLLLAALLVLTSNQSAESSLNVEIIKMPYVMGLHHEKKRLSEFHKLEILENEVRDPYRNPTFESELRKQIEKARMRVNRQVQNQL